VESPHKTLKNSVCACVRMCMRVHSRLYTKLFFSGTLHIECMSGFERKGVKPHNV